ncbi:hypothetical protein R3P38DRAFT_2800815 [Favolaschia claudopus]|uniref:DUF6589 domain-containing protein n=1 Tax=Favolaschia claudopus TaxID=2862362 RepID=A0AAV9ZXK0_9AGAR
MGSELSDRIGQRDRNSSVQHTVSSLTLATLQYDNDYWQSKFSSEEMKTLTPEAKFQLVFSLTIFFSISVRQLLYWLFTTNIPRVTRAVSHFMGYFPTNHSLEEQFGPAMLFALWRDGDRYPRAQLFLRDMTVPCAHELIFEDSNRIITSPLLQVRVKTLTIQQLRDLLHPSKLIEIIKGLAPFTWGLLHTFSASPNAWRKRPKQKAGEEMQGEEEDWVDDPNDDPLESGEAGLGDSAGTSWQKEYPGFSRNPVFAILLTITMLAFVRNRATNLLPLILGLFFKISGTSARVVLMLSNAGICVSSHTVERLKVRITEDAIQLAVQLMTSGQAQQRLSNKNDMINATNSAVVAILRNNLLSVDTGQMLPAMDVLPTAADDKVVGQTFVALIAEMILAFTPGNSKWSERADIAAGGVCYATYGSALASHRFRTPRPFGVFDVNEGSKKGGVKFLKEAQQRSTLSEATWSSIPRIFVGDWLSSNNLRAARRDRTNDINPMERLEYVQELSAPFHFALQVSPYAHAVEDPGSLAAHKGLLNRKWDVNKSNYAAAKSLIRHSLIARILHCVMVIKGFTRFSELSQWRPSLADIQAISQRISTEFATATAAQAAQAAGDEWMAHSVYWVLAFRGVGQHNYARECVEVLVRWKYELSDKSRRALERSWFIHPRGIRGRSIASDLYPRTSQLKRVFIASGSGVTIEYIMRKGSACVEAFRDLTHMVANFFGDPDRARKSKEVKFTQDMEALITEMQRRKFHIVSKVPHFVPAPPKKVRKNAAQNSKPPEAPRSAIIDVFVKGAEEWNGKFKDFIKSTTFDPALGGYPPAAVTASSPRDTTLDTHTVFDNLARNPLDIRHIHRST